MRREFVKFITEIVDKNRYAYLISLDAGQGTFNQIEKENPEKIFNFGVMEQASIGVASGMALEGLKPYVYAITPFLLERPFEQIKLDIVHQKANVKLVGYWDYPGTGITHFTEDDEGLCKILKILFFKPKNSLEAKEVFLQTYKIPGPAFISLTKDTKI